MENASKALIIAGAILISIVLIGVGVLIVGNSQEIFGGASTKMSQMAIDQFNSEFTNYEGRQSGSNIRSLLQTIATHNVTYAGDTDKQVQFNGTVLTQNQLSATKAAVGVGSTYTVSFQYHTDNSGLILNIVTSPVVAVQ